MDSIFAIALGLGIRLLVDVVSQHDFKVGGSLIGLWEGVVLYHFLGKMPKSFDPYVAYGFRLFVDFLFTESLYRMALVILWTALGMVLSDIAPIFWYDLGLRRLYRRFRREVELFGLPTLPFFSKTSSSSRVRFRSPSRASSVVTSVRSIATSTSSSTITPTNLTPNSTPVIPLAVINNTRRKTRIVPGSFPDDWSETDAGSVLDLPHIPPSETSDDESQPPNHDIHPILETDESSAGSDHHGLTETPDDDDLLSETSSESVDPSAKDPLEIPEEDEAPLPDQKQDQDRTPTAHHIPLPPTPAESDVGAHEVQEVQPPLSEVPLIPDSPFVRDTFDTESGEDSEGGSPPPKPIPPVTNHNLSHPANDDPPSTDDIPRDANPPAYNEFPTDAKADPTPEPDETLPNDTTTQDKPLPIINVEPPLPHDLTDANLSNNHLHNESLPPLGSPSQTDKQPKLGDDLSYNGDSCSIVDTERPESMLPENTSIRLEQALTFRREAAKIQKRILDVEGERKKALEDHKSAIALLKSQEREGLEREEKELNRKAERRFFTANNASSTPGEISVTGLEPGEAVSRIEAALAALLQASHGDSVELRVALGQGKKKLIPVKLRIRATMKEHQILVNDGPNASTLIITLPKL